MINTNAPCLCGGTFFVLLLRAKRKSRTKKQLQQYGSDGLTNPAFMEHLIKLFNSDYYKPCGDTLENRTSLYKACKISDGDCLPFNDGALISAFDRRIRHDYGSIYKQMGIITEMFLTTEIDAKMQELVYAILTLIRDDSRIKPEDNFFALPNGCVVNKSALLAIKQINVPALLLGVWHYILMYCKDNTLGESTIAEWHSAPKEKGDKHKFVSPIGSIYDHEIKISTTYEIADDAKKDDIEEFEELSDPIEPEVVLETPSQPDPIINQTIQNQFNFYQNGTGINIGHAEHVEIRDGMVVTLK